VLNIALTGNIGAGKTTVAKLFAGWGATVIDADQLVREAQAPGQPVLQEIAARFGAELITRDGYLDRAALRTIVLHDPGALADLNRIVHPAVHRRRLELLAAARAQGVRIVVSDIPLLFEADDPRAFDAVVLVDAPAAVRRDRLLASRDLAPPEIDRMMAAQMTASDKRGQSDYIIDNDGDPAALERSARRVWEALVARA
jgi:dephospho-CoA kinase